MEEGLEHDLKRLLNGWRTHPTNKQPPWEKMVATMNLKLEHIASRIEDSSNGDYTSVNQSGRSYSTQGINPIQIRFSKINFSNLKVKILVGGFINAIDF